MNHYETLGVDKTATPDEIKKAYRKLASLHHPDKGGETHKFQEIQVANEILSDSNKRQQYDMELAGGGHRQFHFHSSSGMGPDDMSGGGAGDLFEHLRRQFGFGFSGSPDPFGQFRQANQQRQAPRNRDVRIAIQLDLVDNLTELTKTLNITLPGNMKENIEIKIPKGVHTGSTIRYAGLGDHSVPNAPRADLYVQFHLRQHERFEQHGIDLVTTLNINCLEAVVGCSKSVKGIDGSEFMVNIPAGTQYGAKFGIPDQGLYTTEHPGRGRLVVLVDIYVPKELTAEQLETIRAIQSTL